MGYLNMLKMIVFIVVFSFLLTGCALSSHQEFYSQQSPKKYPPTENVMLFEYNNIKLDDIKTILFDDYLVIGKSGFNGPYENPENAISFAKSIGADIVITNAQFKKTINSIVPLTLPSTTTTNFSGYSGGGSFYGSATSYGTQTTMIPITVHRYNQDGMFLKNINNMHPLWERTIKDYQKTTNNELEGNWENESYKLNIFQSGTQIVAFINQVKVSDDRQNFWHENNLKFIFGEESNKGIYLMGNKTPVPSNFIVNKFGFLEIELITSGEKFSFERVK